MAPPARPGSKTPNEVYLKAELDRAIKERDTLKRALEAQDGAAAFFRQMSKDVTRELGESSRTVGDLRVAVGQHRQAAIQFSEQVDALRAQVETFKRGLWEIWSALDADHPMKQPLWAVWAALP